MTREPAPDTPPSTAELRSALDQVRHVGVNSPRAVVRLERRPSLDRSSFAIEELDVELADGEILPLIFKDLSPRALLDPARRSRPTFLYDHRREISTYRILASRQCGTPYCYGAMAYPRAGRYWLFLERVPGVDLDQVGEFGIWLQVARWLASFHQTSDPRIGALPSTRGSHLLRYDGDFYRCWLNRARRFTQDSRSGQPSPGVSTFEHLAERYETIIERLVALPLTLIHGEFYPSNVRVYDTGERLRICPVDWELAAEGPGLIDLAALTAGKWTEEQKRSLALAYNEALLPGTSAPREAEFLNSLDCCRLHVAMQWLGWSAVWSPPADQAQNWLAEAQGVAERLNV